MGVRMIGDDVAGADVSGNTLLAPGTLRDFPGIEEQRGLFHAGAPHPRDQACSALVFGQKSAGCARNVVERQRDAPFGAGLNRGCPARAGRQHEGQERGDDPHQALVPVASVATTPSTRSAHSGRQISRSGM